MFNGNRVVVTMTSWTKRIGNCVKVIQSILDNTVKPDIVFLNLSLEEFPNRLKDLPKDLVELSLKNPIVKIHWVPGPNTKTMKKVFPILKYLDDDDVILPIDDDVNYPLNYIKSRLQDFSIHFQPLVGVSQKTLERTYLYSKYGIYPNLGAGCLFTKKMMRYWEQYLTKEIIDSYNDDTIYAMLEWLNGYIPQSSQLDILSIVNQNPNDKYSSKKRQLYATADELAQMHIKHIRSMFNLSYDESFNVFNRDQHHYIFIPYISQFGDSEEENQELNYAIRGINKFFKEEHTVVIISDKYISIDQPNVKVLVLPRISTSNSKVSRFADAYNRIKYAFETINCNEAIIHWDDTYSLSPYTFEDCKLAKYVDLPYTHYKRGNLWGDGVWNAIDCIKSFKSTYKRNYCSHIPFVFEKDKFLHMINGFDFRKNPYNGDLAYFNIFHQENEVFVPWRCSNTNPKTCIYKKEIRQEKDLTSAFGKVKWATIDLPLIQFDPFHLLDKEYKECK